jgi:DNA helicase HerA-like ATPase
MESDNETVFMGFRHEWGQEVPFGIGARERGQHVYVIGQTGTGKSTLLRNLILQDIEAGRGVGLIDPHGDLASEILEHIPPWRTEDVVYFNPLDNDPLAINLFRATSDTR